MGTESWWLLLEGMMTGVMLTIMVGPVTMVILRHGLIINRAAGLTAAVGTWVSDFVFIALTFWMTISITQWVEAPSNKVGIYTAGGLGLLIMGIVLANVRKHPAPVAIDVKLEGYFRAFMAGFMVNSLSPFTLFFWLGAAAILHLQSQPPMIYYTGVMLTLGLGDFLKAWFAPHLTRWLKAHHMYWVQVVAGIVIAVTGLVIIGKGLLEYFNHS